MPFFQTDQAPRLHLNGQHVPLTHRPMPATILATDSRFTEIGIYYNSISKYEDLRTAPSTAIAKASRSSRSLTALTQARCCPLSNDILLRFRQVLVPDHELAHARRSQQRRIKVRVQLRSHTDTFAVDDPTIAAALRLTRDRPYEGTEDEPIARHTGLSRSVLQRRFRARLRRSVHQEILAAKIRCAQHLLLKSDLPLATVAARAGSSIRSIWERC